MWPLRVLYMCLFALVSAHALEGFQPYWGYNPRLLVRRTEPDIFPDEIAPVWKRQSAEHSKRRDQLSRSRCFFNPITC